jgi:hypothetical protein
MRRIAVTYLATRPPGGLGYGERHHGSARSLGPVMPISGATR